MVGGQWLIPTDDTAMKVSIPKVCFIQSRPTSSFLCYSLVPAFYESVPSGSRSSAAIAASVSADNTRHPSAVDSEQKHRHSEALSVCTDRQLSRALRRSTCARCWQDCSCFWWWAQVTAVTFTAEILDITNSISPLLRAFLKADMNNSVVPSWHVCFGGSRVVWLKIWPAEVPL